MAIFPESKLRKPGYGYDNTPAVNVKETVPEAGNSYIRDVWGGVRFVARMEFNVSTDDYNILYNFWLLNRALGFTFYDFDEDSPTQNIGTGNGATTTFLIPAKETRAWVLTVAGAARTVGVHWDLSVGTGALGEDQVVFRAGFIPPAAAAVVITYTGRRRYTCEFVGDPPQKRSTGFRRRFLSMMVRERFPLGS